jgi:hypothetical protein
MSRSGHSRTNPLEVVLPLIRILLAVWVGSPYANALTAAFSLVAKWRLSISTRESQTNWGPLVKLIRRLLTLFLEAALHQSPYGSALYQMVLHLIVWLGNE